MKYKDLPANNQFCLYAWRGAHLVPSGSVLPCCIYMPGGSNDTRQSYFKSVKLKDSSLTAIRDSEHWRSMRRALIRGDSPTECAKCWEKEADDRWSYRTYVNRDFEGMLDDVEINEDGSLSDELVSFWDVRDTNLCNMKCMMCSTTFSSLLQQEALKHYVEGGDYPFQPGKDPDGNTPVVIENMPADKIRELIIPQLGPATKLIYFAGGEPLISRMHYDMIDYLVENDYAKDVELFYNTNMLKLDHFGRDILGLWKQFKRVKIGASIDAIGKRAEFARGGTVWDKVNHNIVKILKERGSNISLGISSTQSFYTIGGFHELLQWIVDKGITDHVSINHVEFNNNYSIHLYPEELLQETIEKIEKVIAQMPEKQTKQWPFLKRYMLNPDLDEMQIKKHRRLARRSISALEAARGISIKEACPELIPYYDTWRRPHED